MDFQPISFLIYGLPLLLAIPLHEAAHAWVADKCGDPTARRLGRVSFNPFKHVDPLGTVILPGMLILSSAPFVFGWAKPVPVDFRHLRHLRRDMILVAGAGPAINLVLAVISAGILAFWGEGLGEAWVQMLAFSLILNVALMLFNLLPVLPLDGGRILTGLLPAKLAIPFSRTERFGMPLLLLVLVAVPLVGYYLGQDWSLFGKVLGPVILTVSDWLLRLF